MINQDQHRPQLPRARPLHRWINHNLNKLSADHWATGTTGIGDRIFVTCRECDEVCVTKIIPILNIVNVNDSSGYLQNTKLGSVNVCYSAFEMEY